MGSRGEQKPLFKRMYTNKMTFSRNCDGLLEIASANHMPDLRRITLGETRRDLGLLRTDFPLFGNYCKISSSQVKGKSLT